MPTLTKSYQKIGSGSSTTYSQLHLYTYAKYNSQDPNTNKTKVQIKITTKADYSGYASYGVAAAVSPHNLSNTYGYLNWGTTEHTILEKEFEVEHDKEGKYSVSGTSSMSANMSGFGQSHTWEYDLPTIPRATKLVNQTGTIGSEMNITWNKASNSFTHKLEYTFGTYSETIGTGLVDGKKWTPNEKLYEVIKNSPSGTGTLKLTTYSGNTQIGTPQTATLTLKANENNTKPVIEEILVRDENKTTKALTGDQYTLVINASVGTALLTFNTRHYATAKSITINGKVVSVPTGTLQSDKKTTQYSVTTSVGTITNGTFKVVVTDSRGFTQPETYDADVVDYITLSCDAIFKRIAPTTGQVGLQFEGNYFNKSFGDDSNTLAISYKYKKSTESTYTTVNLTKDTNYKISGNTYYSGTGSSKQVITLAPTFDYRSVYNVVMYVEDKLTKLTINVTVVKGIPIMWWNSEKVTINGSLYIADTNGQNAVNVLTKLNDLANITQYSPNSAGTSGQYWKSDGSGRGVWQSLSTTPTSGSTAAITSGGVYTALSKSIIEQTLPSVSVRTTTSYTLLTYKVTTAGTYLITGHSPLNNYNQTERELNLYLKKNGTNFFESINVIQNGWTQTVTICALQTFAANDTLTVVVTSSAAKNWAHGADGKIRMVKL